MILKYFRQISAFFDIILMYKRMNLDVDRRIAELREGRRTECGAQRAIIDRDLLALFMAPLADCVLLVPYLLGITLTDHFCRLDDKYPT